MDLWDQLDGNTWYQPLPAMDVETYVSGETENLFIRKEYEAFWLSRPDVAGQSEYATLEAAKTAGDAILDEMGARQVREIVKAAGLDPDSWTFTLEGDFGVFAPVDGNGPEIVRNGKGRWAAVENDEETLVGTSPAELARQVSERAAFSPSI